MERDKLIEAGMALSSELSLPAVLQRIIEIAVDITDARYGALGVIADGRLTDFITVGLTDEQRAAIGALPTGHGILGLLIHRGTERTPVRIDDITQHPNAHGFPPNHPPMRSFLGAPIVVRGNVFGDVYLTDKQGAAGFTDEDADAVLVLASQAGVAIENARLYEETERRARWLDAVREVTSVVLTGSDPADALPLIARRAREVLDADLASIAVPDGPDELVVRAADGAHADEVVQQRVPRDSSLSGTVMRSGRTEVVDDVSADPRAFRPVADLGDMGPAVYVPLGTEARPIGALSVVNARGGRPFSRDDVGIVEAFGGQAALAIEYMRAQEGLRQVAVLEDRERIARELHDGVIQALFAVGMGLQATAAVTQDDGVSSRVELAVADIDRVIRDLRNYIFGLRPGVLADRHLGEALRDLVTEFEAKTGVVTVADVSDDAASLLASRAGDVLQLAREALSNVGRHASATTCRLTLRSDDTRCVLEVDDDGVGFDPAVVDRGDGLANLEKRAAELGGRLTIESTPGEGATVRVELPA